MQYFQDHEFINPKAVSRKLRNKLEKTRRLAGVPMVITGSNRPRKGKRTSAHQKDDKGIYHAVDIRCRDSRTRFLILKAAFAVGFGRVGIYTRHIHLDVATDRDLRVSWMGKSK